MGGCCYCPSSVSSHFRAALCIQIRYWHRERFAIHSFGERCVGGSCSKAQTESTRSLPIHRLRAFCFLLLFPFHFDGVCACIHTGWIVMMSVCVCALESVCVCKTYGAQRSFYIKLHAQTPTDTCWYLVASQKIHHFPSLLRRHCIADQIMRARTASKRFYCLLLAYWSRSIFSTFMASPNVVVVVVVVDVRASKWTGRTDEVRRRNGRKNIKNAALFIWNVLRLLLNVL